MSKPWPVDWPRYKQSSEICDILVGGCSCGAQHQLGEFTLRSSVLYRYGNVVHSSALAISRFDELKKENVKLHAQIDLAKSRKFVGEAVHFTITACDDFGNSQVFSLGNVANVSKIREAMQAVLGGMILTNTLSISDSVPQTSERPR